MPEVDSLIKGRPGEVKVLMFTSTDCPIANALVPEFKRLQGQVHKDGGAITFVHTWKKRTQSELDTHSKEYAFKAHNIIDRKHELVRRFEGVINAAESKYVMLNASTDSVNKICKLLPGADSPTIIPLQEKNKVAIHALCSEPVFWETMEKLKSNGASSILVMPVEKILN